MSGPDFIGVGPGRAGTSWVKEVLRHTPGVWMSPIKELHYWDRLGPDSGPSPRWTGHRRIRVEANAAALRAGLRGPRRSRFAPAFDVRYFTGRATPRWYGRLFDAAPPGSLAGEITPSYFYMAPAAVDLLGRTLPRVRVFVTLRQPVDRLWSHVVKGIVRDRGMTLAEASDDQLIDFALDRVISYRDSLERWHRALPADQVHVLWFDDLVERPADYVAGLFDFLGLDRSAAAESVVASKVNSAASDADPAPPAFRARLAEALLPDLDRLEAYLGPQAVVARWRAEMEASITT